MQPICYYNFTVQAIIKLADNKICIITTLLVFHQGGIMPMTNTYPEAFDDLKLLHQLKEFLH